jgi:hypothetical protein
MLGTVIHAMPWPAPCPSSPWLFGRSAADLLSVYTQERPEGMTHDEVAAVSLRAVESLGVAAPKCHSVSRASLLPKPPPDAVRAGFFERLEALQGERQTFYSGGLLAFEVVDHIIAYNERLLARYF